MRIKTFIWFAAALFIVVTASCNSKESKSTEKTPTTQPASRPSDEPVATEHVKPPLATQPAVGFHPVSCEGVYPHHLQGICADSEAIYWSFTTQLVKTDLDGKILKKIPVANHHGDLCCSDGKLYIAVNLGHFDDAEGNADSWIYVYRADDLSFISKHEAQEAFYGAGGIGIRDGHYFVVGGLPEKIPENYIYEYDGDFKFVKKHVLKSGHTLMGIQAATFTNGHWYFGCYGKPSILLVTDADLQLTGRYQYDCALGIESLPDGRMLSASGRCQRDVGCTGRINIAVADEKNGLRIVSTQK